MEGYSPALWRCTTQHYGGSQPSIMGVHGPALWGCTVQHHGGAWPSIMEVHGPAFLRCTAQHYGGARPSIMGVHGPALWGFTAQHYGGAWPNIMGVHGPTIWRCTTQHYVALQIGRGITCRERNVCNAWLVPKVYIVKQKYHMQLHCHLAEMSISNNVHHCEKNTIIHILYNVSVEHAVMFTITNLHTCLRSKW